MEKAPSMALFAYGPFKLCPGRQAHVINGRILSLSGASWHSYWWRKRLKGLSHGIVIRCNKAEKYTWMKWSARNRCCFIHYHPTLIKKNSKKKNALLHVIFLSVSANVLCCAQCISNACVSEKLVYWYKLNIVDVEGVDLQTLQKHVGECCTQIVHECRISVLDCRRTSNVEGRLVS